MTSRLTKLMRPLLHSEIGSYQQSAWCPPADVYRCGHGWLVKFDLAGVRTEDIQLSVTGRCLTLQGKRRDWSIEDGQQSYSMEIAYNRFERAIELPCDVEKSQIVTEYRDGMLLIRLQMETEPG